MSRLSELIAKARAADPALGEALDAEFRTLSARRPFGLNFERHAPECVELPGRPVRRGDKVRILPPRGTTAKGDQRLWKVKKVEVNGTGPHAQLESAAGPKAETSTAPVEDLVVVAEEKDFLYPGLISTGKVQRGGEKPFHTVINGENLHALKALTCTHRGKVDVIYIDPPYNSGARDWKYNNDYVASDDRYRHSKWLAMMERRLLVARELLNQAQSVLVVTIDAREHHRLGLLLEQIFPDADIQSVSTVINPKGVSIAGGFRRADEYVFFVMFKTGPERLPLSDEWSASAVISGRHYSKSSRDKEVQDARREPGWTSMMRRGTNSARKDRPQMFYPIFADPETQRIVDVGDPIPLGPYEVPKRKKLVTILPIRSNGDEGYWQVSVEELKSRIKQGRVRLGRSTSYGFVVNYLPDGAYKEVISGHFEIEGYRKDGSLVAVARFKNEMRVAPTQWKIASHNASEYGSGLLSALLRSRDFPFPKSLYAVEDTLRFFVARNSEAIVLDFFAGSGTTAHAVMRLNRQDGGQRQCISITNNEVGADEQAILRKKGLRPGDAAWEKHGICDFITKPRIEAAITGRTPDGAPIKGDYKFTDEFPMADGFAENAEFFTLSYEAPVAVSHNRAFERIAPLLWMRAGAQGRRIDKLPTAGFDVADTYALLTEPDKATPFARAVKAAKALRLAFIVTDDERRFQSIARRLPHGVEPVRLYESYLTNFRFALGGAS